LKGPLETGYDHALYLALRRGLLLVEAQSVWLGEVTEFLSSRTEAGGRLTRP
jgi:hypothetical protein